MKTTIGGFDGMHLAHAELIKRSDNYLVIEKKSTLTPFFSRVEYNSKLLDILNLENIKNLSKNKFIEILKSYGIKKIVVGYDFRFGKNRSGDISDLKKAFEVEVVKEIKYQTIPIHSRIIRELIKKNNIKKANALLGHNYKIKGTKIKGQGLGSRELLPTINLKLLYDYTLPYGVFLTKTNNYFSITFVGNRSTDKNFAIETHILNKKIDIENKKIINIEFLEFLRENKRFNNLNELKKAIIEDKKIALQIIKEKYGIS